jgi:hypothetical protein
MTLFYSENSSETTVPVHQTTTEKTVFLKFLHLHENSKLYTAPNLK